MLFTLQMKHAVFETKMHAKFCLFFRCKQNCTSGKIYLIFSVKQKIFQNIGGVNFCLQIPIL